MAMRRSSLAGTRGEKVLTRRPVIFVIVVVLAIALAYGIAGAVASALHWSQYGLLALANGILTLAGAWALWRRGGLAAAGFRASSWGRAAAFSGPLFVPAVVTLVLALVLGGGWTFPEVWVYLGLALLVGLAEEIQFRALIYGALRPLGVARGVVLSSALFGMLHAMNLARGAGVAGTVLQVVYAFALGCAFAAVLEVGGRLAPLVAAHASTDFFAYVAGAGVLYAGGHDGLLLVISALYVVVFGGYAWWLVRRSRRLPAPS